MHRNTDWTNDIDKSVICSECALMGNGFLMTDDTLQVNVRMPSTSTPSTARRPS